MIRSLMGFSTEVQAPEETAQTGFLQGTVQTALASGVVYVLAMQILTNLQDKAAFEGRFNLSMLYLSCVALSYASSYIIYSEDPEASNILSSGLAAIGGFFATLRCAHTFVKGGEKQFDSILDRSLEILAVLGSAFVGVRIGIAVGITPSDVMSFTASAISFGARFAYRCVF